MSTIVNKTSGLSTAEQASHSTASITPAANSIGLLTFSSLVPGQTTSSTPTVSGNGRTWTKVRAVSFEADNVLYTYVGTGAGSAGTITITHAGNDSIGCSWIVDEITGCNLTTPIVQSNGAFATSGTTASVTLGAFSGGSNATYGVGYSPELITVGSGFTALFNGSGAFDIQHLSEWKATNDTSVDFTLGGSGNWAIMGFEIAEPAAGGSILKQMLQNH